jgi:aminoglycoside phosphotransferase (APT) family kinase protein
LVSEELVVAPKTTDDLAVDVAQCLGLAEVTLRLSPMGGASHLAYEVHDPAGNGAPVAFLRCEGGFAGMRYGLRREAGVLRSAAALGLPVPQVLGTPGEPPGLLMNLVAGTSRLTATEAEAVAAEYLSQVARIHAADPTSFPVEHFATISEALDDDLRWWEGYAAGAGAMEQPILRLGARVLAATLPRTDERPSLVHGDVGAGNFMTENGRVTALIDWELAHVGDPHEDLAWLWMRGAHSSFGDPRQRLADYEAASGATLDGERLRWHLALVMWKSCVGMYADFRRPPDAGSFVQSMVLLTYDALLGVQLLRLLGRSYQLLEQVPVRQVSLLTRPADQLLEAETLSKESRLIVTHLREAAAQAAWERDELVAETRTLLGTEPAWLLEAVDAADADLGAVALVLTRAADRAAMALPNAVRRIQRAQHIGLGTAEDPTKGNR